MYPPTQHHDRNTYFPLHTSTVHQEQYIYTQVILMWWGNLFLTLFMREAGILSGIVLISQYFKRLGSQFSQIKVIFYRDFDMHCR